MVHQHPDTLASMRPAFDGHASLTAATLQHSGAAIVAAVHTVRVVASAKSRRAMWLLRRDIL